MFLELSSLVCFEKKNAVGFFLKHFGYRFFLYFIRPEAALSYSELSPSCEPVHATE